MSAPRRVKAVQLLVNSILPEDMRNYEQSYDAKNLNKILYAVARKHPDKFGEVDKKMSDIGRLASYYQGETIDMGDLIPVIDKKAIYAQMKKEIAALPKNKDFIKNRREIWQKYNTLIERETAKNALANGNNIAMSVLSGARGKNPQLKAMISTPGQYSDYKGNPIDMFIEESFAEGIRPSAFLASTFGSRSSVISTKSSTAKGGDLAKQMVSAAANLIVRKEDCGTHNGVRMEVDHSDLRGRELVADVGGFKAGTFVDKRVQEQLQRQGVKSVVARSPMTCSVVNGLCAHCVGKFYSGSKLPRVGTAIGHLAATASMEPVCLVKGTLVRMANGTSKAIEDIVPGDMVLGSDENAHCAPVRVVNVFHNGLRDCYRTGVKKGRGSTSEIVYLESTKEHKVLSFMCDRRNRVGHVTPTVRPIGLMPRTKDRFDKLMCQFPVAYEGGYHEPFAMLLGMLVGDGSYKGTASGSVSKGVRFSCYDDEQVETLRKNLAPLKLRVQNYTEEHEFRIVSDNQCDKTQWTYDNHGNYIRNKARAKLIEEEMWGQDCYTKTLPKTIWEWSHKSVCEFVGGLIATDGYVTADGRVGYSSNNKALLEQIKILLETRLGVYGSRITGSAKKKEDGTAYNPTYSFLISEAGSIRSLAEQVTVPGRKDALLRRAATRTSRSRHGFYKVVEQTHIGMRDTYDIEVDNASHLFVLANGLIVSNTQMALCLSLTTKVRMADNSTKMIKDIKVGELVLGADKLGNTFPVKVLTVFDQGEKDCYSYELSSGDSVVCTKDHKFLLGGGTYRVEPIGEETGKLLASVEDEVEIVSITREGIVPCYDLEVDHPDHLFVLANNVICSNSAKHTAGMTQAKKTFSGLDAIIQFTQSPEAFRDQAPVAEQDGTVDSIDEAPQGGFYVTVGKNRHYVPRGHEVLVKRGEKVEAGDQLADGLIDPEDIVRLKGIGAGRKYYAERLNQILKDSGAASGARNTEVLARAAINHVRIDDADGMSGWLPDDVVTYDALQANYIAPDTAKVAKPKDAAGMYLQSPAVHYTIGTRLTPKVIKDIEEAGIEDILVDEHRPQFSPEMTRLRTASHVTDDWLAAQGTSYLSQQLVDAAVRGADTNVRSNEDYRPRLAVGVGFGENVEQEGKF